MIDVRRLKELVKLMVANELTEIDLRDGEEQVTLRRPDPHAGVTAAAPPMAMPTAPVIGMPGAPATPPAAPTPAPAPAGGGGGEASGGDEDAGFSRIESPIVGTFYTAPTPDADPFVQPGVTVGPDSTVCIIEAMKIFNEIKAEQSGTIEKVLVKNGEPVEFGQPLFLVRPS